MVEYGRIDARYLHPNMGFINISCETNHLFKNWFIAKESLEFDNRKSEESEGKYIYF